MSDVMMAPIRERLWHKMRHDLASFIPEIAESQLLMCCACGRFLPQECFDLEHLIPQQALKRDPNVVRTNPVTPANVRAGNLLLCKKPLMHKGTTVYRNGCNSWKGRFYDKPINELVFGEASEPQKCTQVHIIAALGLAYLAMVAEFGYAIALMQSGLLMRKQFFSPFKYLSGLPLRSQMVLSGSLPVTSPDARMWAKPFSFSFQNSACTVGIRNLALIVPVSRDPRVPIARHLRIVPAKYKLHPNFRTVFD
jgi:hypothetical protein